MFTISELDLILIIPNADDKGGFSTHLRQHHRWSSLHVSPQRVRIHTNARASPESAAPKRRAIEETVWLGPVVVLFVEEVQVLVSMRVHNVETVDPVEQVLLLRLRTGKLRSQADGGLLQQAY